MNRNLCVNASDQRKIKDTPSIFHDTFLSPTRRQLQDSRSGTQSSNDHIDKIYSDLFL